MSCAFTARSLAGLAVRRTFSQCALAEWKSPVSSESHARFNSEVCSPLRLEWPDGSAVLRRQIGRAISPFRWLWDSSGDRRTCLCYLPQSIGLDLPRKHRKATELWLLSCKRNHPVRSVRADEDRNAIQGGLYLYPLLAWD